MKTVAWHNAAPGKQKSTRREQYRRKHGEDPPMPEVEYADHLIGYLFEFGPATATGAGLSPVGFAEIDAWSTLTGTPVTSWEALALREMSMAYVTMSHDAQEVSCPNPYRQAPSDPQDIADEMDKQFARLESIGARRKR